MKTRTAWLVAAATLGAVLAAAPAISAPKMTPLHAKLKGSQEVPDPGDPNGKGKAKVALKPGKEKICFKIKYKRLTDVVAAHIHEGDKGVAGPVVVPLLSPSSPLPGKGREKGCVKEVEAELIREIKQAPGSYYVNLHSSDFPAGAIRGQLKHGKNA